MELIMDRLVHIIACMYDKNAEAVVDIGKDECFIFLGATRDRLPISYNEVLCLVHNEILEFDSGNNERGHETEVYRLTEKAQEKIKAIIKDKGMLELKD